jgi:hypothetical protein
MPCPDDPGRPRESHQNDSFAWASRKRTRSPPASLIGFSGLYQTSGRCGLPYGLHGSLCTLQTFRSVCRSRLSSYGSATLGTGGWLDLTRQGLAPCKKRQACLGAHVMPLSARPVQSTAASRSLDPTKATTASECLSRRLTVRLCVSALLPRFGLPLLLPLYSRFIDRLPGLSFRIADDTCLCEEISKSLMVWRKQHS